MKPVASKYVSKLGWSTLTIDAAVFGLDGVIVDFNMDFTSVRAEVICLLTQQGLLGSLLSVNERLFVTLKEVEKRMKESGKEKLEFIKPENVFMPYF